MVISVSKMPHIFLTISIFLSILDYRYGYLDLSLKKSLVEKIKLHDINIFIKISQIFYRILIGAPEQDSPCR